MIFEFASTEQRWYGKNPLPGFYSFI